MKSGSFAAPDSTMLPPRSGATAAEAGPVTAAVAARQPAIVARPTARLAEMNFNMTLLA
jgi:hypothetical protein